MERSNWLVRMFRWISSGRHRSNFSTRSAEWGSESGQSTKLTGACDEEGREDLRTAYSAAVALWIATEEGFWRRFNAQLLSNGILLLAVVSSLNGTFQLPIVGLALSAIGLWLSIMWLDRVRGFRAYIRGYIMSAASLEQQLLPSSANQRLARIRTVQQFWRLRGGESLPVEDWVFVHQPRSKPLDPDPLQASQPWTLRDKDRGAPEYTTVAFAVAYLILFATAGASLGWPVLSSWPFSTPSASEQVPVPATPPSSADIGSDNHGG